MPGPLTAEQFVEVLARAPLVSIDLIVRDPQGRVLLGRRTNSPAKGSWFVPGGRIYKGETLEAAFKRITLAEIKETHSQEEAGLCGVYTHTYDDNVFHATDAQERLITTHYVVLAYELCLSDSFERPKSTNQHSEFRWFTAQEAENAVRRGAGSEVHEYILPYFQNVSRMTPEQYQCLNARRDSFNNLLWQSPLISLTAQAFLFAVILSGETTRAARIIACFLSLSTSFASIHLLMKHRFMEQTHAKILRAYEEANLVYAANRTFRAASWIVRRSSYRLWKCALWIFVIAALLAILLSELGCFDSQ